MLFTVSPASAMSKYATITQDLNKIMKNYITEKRKTIPGVTLDAALYLKMSLTQLVELKSVFDYLHGDRGYIAILFQKSFEVCFDDKRQNLIVSIRIMIRILRFIGVCSSKCTTGLMNYSNLQATTP